jgi:hypothetical protein
VRCYFLNKGHIAAVELLTGLPDIEAIAKGHQLYSEQKWFGIAPAWSSGILILTRDSLSPVRTTIPPAFFFKDGKAAQTFGIRAAKGQPGHGVEPPRVRLDLSKNAGEPVGFQLAVIAKKSVRKNRACKAERLIGVGRGKAAHIWREGLRVFNFKETPGSGQTFRYASETADPTNSPHIDIPEDNKIAGRSRWRMKGLAGPTLPARFLPPRRGLATGGDGLARPMAGTRTRGIGSSASSDQPFVRLSSGGRLVPRPSVISTAIDQEIKAKAGMPVWRRDDAGPSPAFRD